MPANIEVPAPRAKFFWFLPTSGDSRSIVASSHASSNQVLPPNYRAPDPRLPRRGGPRGRPARLRGRAHADRNLVRGRLVDGRGAVGRDREAEVPGRLPARAGAAHAGRPAGSDVAALLRGPGAAQHRQRRRRRRAAPLRRLARTTTSAMPAPASSCTSSTRCGARTRLDFKGDYYKVAGRRVSAPPDPLPQIYFGGSSPAALPIAAQYVDVYLTWGEPPQAAAAKIARVRELAEARGRNVRFGIRLHTISRDTSAAAWAVADELVAGLSDEQIAKQTALHAQFAVRGSAQDDGTARRPAGQLEIYPNLWAGVGLVRGGAGTALVGSHEEVANLIFEYHSLGIRRIHPVGLSTPRGGVLVRRGSASAAAAEGCRVDPRRMFVTP